MCVCVCVKCVHVPRVVGGLCEAVGRKKAWWEHQTECAQMCVHARACNHNACPTHRACVARPQVPMPACAVRARRRTWPWWSPTRTRWWVDCRSSYIHYCRPAVVSYRMYMLCLGGRRQGRGGGSTSTFSSIDMLCFFYHNTIYFFFIIADEDAAVGGLQEVVIYLYT